MEKGQSFFELLLAIVVISVSLIVLVQLSTKSVSNSTFAKEKTVASRYVQEAIEWARGERDMNWAAFVSRSSAIGTNWCLDASPLAWPATSGTCGANSYIVGTTLYKRQAILRTVDSNTIEATVVTTWQDAKGTHQSQASILLTNWRQATY